MKVAQNLDVPHIYSAVSTSAGWTNWINGALLFSTNVNAVSFFGTNPRVGRGADNHYYHGSIAELLIFDRALTPPLSAVP